MLNRKRCLCRERSRSRSRSRRRRLNRPRRRRNPKSSTFRIPGNSTWLRAHDRACLRPVAFDDSYVLLAADFPSASLWRSWSSGHRSSWYRLYSTSSSRRRRFRRRCRRLAPLTGGTSCRSSATGRRHDGAWVWTDNPKRRTPKRINRVGAWRQERHASQESSSSEHCPSRGRTASKRRPGTGVLQEPERAQPLQARHAHKRIRLRLLLRKRLRLYGR